ncbi:unnamed protein product [Ranitomeya imitator]|uniref:Uncharacterized protein n=1 Tax=Ranitomeya imitator TaxID=111125 RepID=A0ABN9MHB0_9NEOB|nr:unnamed protein product [Ranitomeya imitator]
MSIAAASLESCHRQFSSDQRCRFPGNQGSYYDGRVSIGICWLNVFWSSLSHFQIKSLTQPDIGYQRGCDCKIKYCVMESYDNLAPNECPCIGWQQSQILEREHACIKRRDGTCSWYPSIPDKSIYSHP